MREIRWSGCMQFLALLNRFILVESKLENKAQSMHKHKKYLLVTGSTNEISSKICASTKYVPSWLCTPH